MFERFRESLRRGKAQRGQVSAQRAVGLVVALMVGGLVAAFLLPVAINELVAVDTSSWGSGASSIWDIMDLIVVLAVFLFFIGIALSASNKV
jgi:succinate dehydrogenase hydrophobic anchor subunit